MKSMTGYGYREFEDDSLSLSVELKSYNNRYLDFMISLPSFLNPMESRIKQLAAGKVRRGRVEINVRLKELAEDITVVLDEKVLKSYGEVLTQCIDVAGLDDSIRLEHLLQIDGILKPLKNRDIEKIWTVLEPLAEEALKDFLAEREREGENTRKDILGQLSLLEESGSVIKGYADSLEEKLIQDIRQRFEELMGANIDEHRLYNEVAVLLMKYSIHEELNRLEGHLASFHEMIEESGAIGKKLDFLCQEINREINTIASKSTILDVNKHVVIMKDALENIREQLRNVE